VLIPPIMISPSPAAPLQLTAVAGETITLSAQLHGTLPIFSRWRLTRNVGGTVTIGDLINQQLVSSIPLLVSNTSGGRVILRLTNWTATAIDPDSPSKRFYRLATPALP